MSDEPDICKLCNKQITEENQSDGSHVIPVIRAESSTVFFYGIAGQFEFDAEQPLQKGDLICQACIAARPHHPYLGAECAMCHTRYPVQWSNEDGSVDGVDCFGHVLADAEGGKRISCGYGSKHDMTKFRFRGPSQLPVGSLVCDRCIDTIVAAGSVDVDASFWTKMDRDLGGVPGAVPLSYGVPSSGNAE